MTPEERRAEGRERLEEAVRDLMTSEGWQRWAETRSRFHSYSLNNTLLIAAQCPTASRVAGYKAWQKLGRQVRKGERGIRIFAPMVIRSKVAEGSDDEPATRLLFKVVSVFDISQTDGEPLPEMPGAPVEGDSHKEYLGTLEDFAATLGYSVTYEALSGGTKGYCAPDARRIVVESSMAPNRKVKVLVHEIAHALGVGYDEYGRKGAEVIVETATYIVCGTLGLDTSSESLPYVAGWGEGDDLDALKKHAATVDEIAGKLETALGLGRKSAGSAAAEVAA